MFKSLGMSTFRRKSEPEKPPEQEEKPKIAESTSQNEYGVPLFDHQKDGVNFLVDTKKAILADEMGLGKTRQAIVAERIAMQGGVGLIVCPASLKINWKREIQDPELYPNDRVTIVESGKERPLPQDGWIIINYDLLGKYLAQLIGMRDRGIIKAITLDEAHYIKGKKAGRAQMSLEIVKGIEHVYALTGTPIMNRPRELYNLLVAVDHPLGRHGRKTFFLKRYCDQKLKVIPCRGGRVIKFWDDTGASNLNELHSVTKDIILRRLKKDNLNLPPKIISVENVTLSKEAQREYENAWDKYVAFCEGNIDEMIPAEGDTQVFCRDCGRHLTKDEAGPEDERILNGGYEKCFKCTKMDNIMAAQHLVELTKLKQVCSVAKIPRVVEDIENMVEQESKVIVFTQFKSTVEMLMAAMKAQKIKAVKLTGEDSMNARQVSIDAFQKDPETKVFVGNIKAAGVGITLTAASQVIFMDMEWSPGLHDQAADRAHRNGQKNMVNVRYYVAEDTIEEDNIDILKRKLSIIGTAVDGTVDEEQGTLAGEFLARIKKRLGTTR